MPRPVSCLWLLVCEGGLTPRPQRDSVLDAVARLARDLRLAGTLRRDANAGQAVIIRGPTEGENQGALGPPVEYLAVSGILWTHGGQPAGWRGTPTRHAA